MWSRKEKRQGGGNGNSENEEEGKRSEEFLPLTIHLRGNPTNFPPFRHLPPFQLWMLKLSHQRGVVNITRDLYLLMPLAESAMIRFIELDLRLEFSRLRDDNWGWDNGEPKLMENFISNEKKAHPDLISNFPRKEQKRNRNISINVIPIRT